MNLRVRRLECNFTDYSLHSGDRSLQVRDSNGQRRHWDVLREREGTGESTEEKDKQTREKQMNEELKCTELQKIKKDKVKKKPSGK